MRKSFAKMATALAIACLAFVGSTSSAYATGPLYPSESSGNRWVDSSCWGTVSAASDAQNGNFYYRITVGVGCSLGTLKLDYVDNSGIQRSTQGYIHPGITYNNQLTLSINRSQYRSVLEVIGGINGHTGSTTCYLFYNPNFVSCG